MTTKDYFARLPSDQRKALERLHRQILRLVPDAEEHFGYGLPGLRVLGHPFLYFGAAKSHCALYGSIPPGFTERLAGFKHSKGAIQFTPVRPIPADVLRDIVRVKLIDQEARWGSEASARRKAVKGRMKRK